MPHRSDRWIAFVLAVVALGVRLQAWWKLTGGTPIPLGPDGDNWLVFTRALLEGVPHGLAANRFPLVPWGARAVVRLAGVEPLWALQAIGFAAGAFAVVATWFIARRFLAPWPALVPAIWAAGSPLLVAVGISPTAYGVFAAGFLVVALSCFGGGGRVGPGLAAAGALVATASMNQGLLCVAALLPAALLAGLPRVAAGAGLGAAAGHLLVRVLHPEAHSPWGWMLHESWRYLSGNVAEEVGLVGPSVAGTWLSWSWGAFGHGPGWTVGALVLAAVGLAAGLGRWGRVARAGAGRRTVASLAWSMAPLGLLVPLMASPHHLVHLAPLAMVAATLGLAAVVPHLGRPVVGGVLAAVLSGLLWTRQEVPVRRFAGFAREARVQQALVARVIPWIPGEQGTILSRVSGRVDPVVRLQWLLPVGVQLVGADELARHPDADHLRRALEDGRPVVVVGDTAPPWTVGGWVLQPTEAPATLVDGQGGTLYLAPVQAWGGAPAVSRPLPSDPGGPAPAAAPGG